MIFFTYTSDLLTRHTVDSKFCSKVNSLRTRTYFISLWPRRAQPRTVFWQHFTVWEAELGRFNVLKYGHCKQHCNSNNFHHITHYSLISLKNIFFFKQGVTLQPSLVLNVLGPQAQPPLLAFPLQFLILHGRSQAAGTAAQLPRQMTHSN